MTRNTFALKVNEGRKQVFREGLGKIWSGITIALDKAGAANFSMWQVDDIVFGYYETKEKSVVCV
ncbi:MAG: hypothetical protein II497_00345 [Lachnospiraceae bacterium]|nr:hypothetical protein [Lachnospiraceae bacterium]MBQ2452883.1 hypothetical protein [Lachnospiraceae bacterium]MBQ4241906.1 hypothetical protein [Lachnospiraceae bacterium]MBQ5534202.1 hypothetical protein [Lachnospiraceae bacterium]